MKLKQLSKDEVITLFNERIVNDFAKEEIKPLNVILKAMDDGIYECLGLFDGDTIYGYTFLVKMGMNYLVDYVAVYPEHRNNGVGSKMLSCLSDYLAKADLVIGEVSSTKEMVAEIPDFVSDALAFRSSYWKHRVVPAQEKMDCGRYINPFTGR